MPETGGCKVYLSTMTFAESHRSTMNRLGAARGLGCRPAPAHKRRGLDQYLASLPGLTQ
jgi:hypothetical protein